MKFTIFFLAFVLLLLHVSCRPSFHYKYVTITVFDKSTGIPLKDVEICANRSITVASGRDSVFLFPVTRTDSTGVARISLQKRDDFGRHREPLAFGFILRKTGYQDSLISNSAKMGGRYLATHQLFLDTVYLERASK